MYLESKEVLREILSKYEAGSLISKVEKVHNALTNIMEQVKAPVCP